MNYASAELNRLLSLVTERHNGDTADFTADNLFYFKGVDGYQGYVNYYFFDKGGTNKYGDTSLHRLLAMHVPGHVVQDFLDKMKRHQLLLDATGSNYFQQDHPPHALLSIDPPKLDCVNHAGVAPLHVTVCRNSWHAEEVVKVLLREYESRQNDLVRRGLLHPRQVRSLASIPISSSNTYPLHIACGMHTTIRRDLLMTLLSADPHVALKEDINNDNAFTLLWKNVLQFYWARLMERGEPIEFIDHCAESLPSWQTVIGRDEYWKYSMLMLRSVMHMGDKEGESNGSILLDKEQDVTLHRIAAIPRCPSLLLRMALASNSFRSQLIEPDGDGMLPLHHMARQQAYSTQYLPFPRSVPFKLFRRVSPVLPSNRINANVNMTRLSPSLAALKAANSLCPTLQPSLDILTQAYPAAAAVPDYHGLLPIHYALQNGKMWTNGIQTLFEAYPEGISVIDSQTRLYPFMMAASIAKRSITDDKSSSKISQKAKPNVSNKVKLEGLTTSFMLLKLRPEVISYCLHS